MQFLILIATLYVLLLVLIRASESAFIYFPNTPGRLDGDWHPQTMPVQEVWLTTSDGTKIHTWWILTEHAKFTFITFHGNAGNITHRAYAYQFLRQLPANVLAVEYQGYGRSEGSPSEAGLYRDAEAGFQYLVTTRGLDPHTIISYGQSLGTTVAAHLAAERPVGGVVLEAPLPSLSIAARKFMWYLRGLGLLAHGQFDTIRRVKKINAPILIVQCDHDPVLPVEFGREVAEASHPRSTFLELKGDCHEEASLVAPEIYREALLQFLTSIPARTTQN